MRAERESVEGQVARVVDAQGARRGHGHDPRQQPVLHRLDARAQRCPVVGRQDRDGLLGHDRPAVERLVDEVDGHARDRDPRRERVVDGMQPRERRQQRRMDVEDPAAERAQGAGSQDAHEAGQHDHVRVGLLETRRETHVPRRAVGMTRRRHVQHRDALLDGPLHARADACPRRRS